MWQFVLTTLAGTSLGEIKNASNRKVSLPLSRMAGGGFTVRLDHRRANEILSCDCLVKAYEIVGENADGTPNKVLRALGEIITAEEVADEKGGSVAVTFGDAMFRLLHRMVGRDRNGYSYGTAAAPVDRGTIMANMITTTQSASGDCGIRIGNIGTSSSTYVGPWLFQRVAERIAELSASLDGPDFEFVPCEPTADASGIALWTFNTYAAKGATMPNAIFEFGTGKKNVKSYKRPVSKDGLMNVGFQLPANFPENATQSILTATDPDSISTRGRYEDVVPSDLVVDALRQKLLEAHIKVRKAPRQVISFEPHIHNAPQFGVDYNVGDVVHFRAVRGTSVRVDGLFRVYGVDFDIDDNGSATPSLQIAPE